MAGRFSATIGVEVCIDCKALNDSITQLTIFFPTKIMAIAIVFVAYICMRAVFLCMSDDVCMYFF